MAPTQPSVPQPSSTPSLRDAFSQTNPPLPHIDAENQTDRLLSHNRGVQVNRLGDGYSKSVQTENVNRSSTRGVQVPPQIIPRESRGLQTDGRERQMVDRSLQTENNAVESRAEPESDEMEDMPISQMRAARRSNVIRVGKKYSKRLRPYTKTVIHRTKLSPVSEGRDNEVVDEPNRRKKQSSPISMIKADGKRSRLSTLPSNEIQYPCDECGKIFLRPYYLLRHQRLIHKKPDSTRFSCSTCHKIFNSREKLRTHQIRSHTQRGSGFAFPTWTL